MLDPVRPARPVCTKRAGRGHKTTRGRPELATSVIPSGLRIREATALTWDDVDLDRGSVSIRRTIQRLKGRGLVVGEPKTARSRRTVYLPSGTVAALHFHEDRQKIKRKKAQNLWQNRNLVFCTAVGGPIDPSTVNPALHRRLKAAGLPRLRVHDLRDAAATYLLSLGVHPKVVQDMLGHSSIALTLNTYTHVVPALHREAAGQMERLFSAPADAPDGPVDARDGKSSLGHPDAI